MKLFRNLPGCCFSLCRPKGHGKALLCSMAQPFYNIMNKPHFDKMFPGVDAKDFNPHPASFIVLSLNFEGLQPSDLTSSKCGSEFERNFQNNLLRSLLDFCKKYELDIPVSPPWDANAFFRSVTGHLWARTVDGSRERSWPTTMTREERSIKSKI